MSEGANFELTVMHSSSLLPLKFCHLLPELIMSLYHSLKLKLAAELLVTLAGEVMLPENKLGAGRGRWRKSRLVSLRAVAHDLGVACGRPMIICLLPCYGCPADHRRHVISIQSVVNDGYCLPSLL